MNGKADWWIVQPDWNNEDPTRHQLKPSESREQAMFEVANCSSNKAWAQSEGLLSHYRSGAQLDGFMPPEQRRCHVYEGFLLRNIHHLILFWCASRETFQSSDKVWSSYKATDFVKAFSVLRQHETHCVTNNQYRGLLIWRAKTGRVKIGPPTIGPHSSTFPPLP